MFFTLETRLALNSGLSLFLNPSRSVKSHSGKSIASEPERALTLCILGRKPVLSSPFPVRKSEVPPHRMVLPTVRV